MISTEVPSSASSRFLSEWPPDLVGCVKVTRVDVDSALESLPENLLEARRALTRELGIDPGAEELQTIVKMAHDPAGLGAVHELSRLILTVRVVAERAFRELFDSRELDAANVTRAAELIPALLDCLNDLEHKVDTEAEGLEEAERTHLLQAANALPAQENLIAAAVVGPRLVQFASTGGEELRATIPSLTDGEVELIAAAREPDGLAEESVGRVCLRALALRTVMSDDLSAWDALGAEGVDAAEALAPAVECLKRDAAAYRVVSRLLQEQQDAAVMAGQRDFLEELRRAKQALFAVYLKVASALNAGTPVSHTGKSAEQKEAELKKLLARSAAVDALAKADRDKRVTKDEIYLDALKKMRPGKAEIETVPSVIDLRKERLRKTALGTVAGVLAVACMLIWVFVPGRDGTDLRVPVSELPDSLSVNKAVAVGPMLYAEVDSWIWNDLDKPERLARVNEIGSSARSRGFDTVYLTDEAKTDLAIWNATDGAALVQN